MKHLLTLLFLIATGTCVWAQEGKIQGKVTDKLGKPVPQANISITGTSKGTATDADGYFALILAPGRYTVQFSAVGFKPASQSVMVSAGAAATLNFMAEEVVTLLQPVEVSGVRSISGMGYLEDVHQGAILSGKKTEVLLLDSLDGNLAQNNPRQSLGRIPGANYSETDGNGFPTNGIGLRGLNPSQSIETNTRQNGYSITADLYGYPESYYLPPLEAVERIEIIRGAASLQYGPQFGGVINYIMKRHQGQGLTYQTAQTAGSYGLFNSFHSVSGNISPKSDFYSYVQYQQGDGWRANGDYRKLNAFARVEYRPKENLKLGLEYTLLRNRLHMSGGQTDSMFQANVASSNRTRNWITTPWNILAATMEWKPTARSLFTAKLVGNVSSRSLVWFDQQAKINDVPDANGEYALREVEKETFTSVTADVRYTLHYGAGARQHTLASGMRVYFGSFGREEDAIGTSSKGFDLSLTEAPEETYTFTTTNIAPFVENTFRLSDRFSLTPGLRLEILESTVEGEREDPITGLDVEVDDERVRAFLLGGLGAQYRTSESTNLYANISQAYRPIDYSSLTPLGTIATVDPNLRDSRGYNADFGFRGSVKRYLTFDVGGFFLQYNDRIGLIEKLNSNGVLAPYRTNVANSAHVGLESYTELALSRLWAPQSAWQLSAFNSLARIEAKYTSGAYQGNYVEYAPRLINRTGLTLSRKGFSTTLTRSFTDVSYGDATNSAVASADAVTGVIPAYTVLDWSAMVSVRAFKFRVGINNLTNEKYFTKRTDEYPGPGIIPSATRNYYAGIGWSFAR